jgi:flagellar hook-length control protein FliK
VVPVTPQAQTGDSLPVEAPKGTNPATSAVDIAGQHETALPGQTQARQASPNVVETQPAAGGVTDQAGQRVTPETGFDARPALTPAAGDEPAPAPEALNVKASGRPDPMAGRIDSPVTASQTDAQPAESPGQPIVTGALQASQPQVGTTNVVVQSSATPQVPDVPALHQVVETVNLIDRRDGSQVRLRLHPEALGELVIRLAVSGNDVSVHMMAETSQALIQEHLPQLKAAFVAQGFQADGLSVAVGGDTSAFDASAQQQGDWYQGSDAAPVPVLPDETAAEVEQRPLPETWQGSHAVDYHV